MELQIIRTRHPPEAYIAQLADLLSASGLSASPEDLHRRLDLLPRGDRLLMAVVGDHLLGYAHIRVSHDLLHEETAEILAIVVHPQHRRQGIGRRLIAAAETWARQSGRARLVMRTDVTEAPAHAFYVAMGYQRAGTLLEFVRHLSEDG